MMVVVVVVHALSTRTRKQREGGGGGYGQRGTSCFGDLLRTPTSARFIEKAILVVFEKKRFEATNNIVSPCLVSEGRN